MLLPFLLAATIGDFGRGDVSVPRAEMSPLLDGAERWTRSSAKLISSFRYRNNLMPVWLLILFDDIFCTWHMVFYGWLRRLSER